MAATRKLPRPASALVVSARAGVFETVDRALARDDYVLLPAVEREDVYTWVQDLPPDVVFVDHGTDGRGIPVLKELAEDPRVAPWTPVFLVHDAPLERSQVIQGVVAGAWDVLTFPLDEEITRIRVRSMVAGKLEADDTHAGSILDDETGLYTWRGLVERAEELSALAVRHRRAIGCVAFAPDLDHEGLAETGTSRLREIAARMATVTRGIVRRSDLIGIAAGPTDFLVLAPDTNATGAQTLAGRLTAATRQNGDDGDTLRTRAGYYGVADMLSAGIRPVDLLMRAARALRAAQAGRLPDAVRFYDTGH